MCVNNMIYHIRRKISFLRDASYMWMKWYKYGTYDIERVYNRSGKQKEELMTYDIKIAKY